MNDTGLQLNTILVGLDFTEKDEETIKLASQYSKAFGCKLHLVHITNLEPDFVGFEGHILSLRNEYAALLKDDRKWLQDAVTKLKDSGVDAHYTITEGEPVKAFLDIIEERQPDLLIFGNHHHGLWYKVFLGSMTDELAKKTSCPILLV